MSTQTNKNLIDHESLLINSYSYKPEMILRQESTFFIKLFLIKKRWNEQQNHYWMYNDPMNKGQ